MDGMQPYNNGTPGANGANGDGYGTPVAAGMGYPPNANELTGPGNSPDGNKTTLW